MNEIKYEIIRRIALIKEESGGWATELNEVSWNGAEPKSTSAAGTQTTRRWERASRSREQKPQIYSEHYRRS